MLEIRAQLASFALEFILLGSLVGPPEKSFASVATDGAVMRVVNFPGWCLVRADRADPLVIHFRDVGVDQLQRGVSLASLLEFMYKLINNAWIR